MKTDYYLPENLQNTSEEVSPSGRHKLVIRWYGTKKGCWNYSRGTVYRLNDNTEICDIKRNYGDFNYSFIEKDKQEWLVTGRSYMSQTLVNLDTGQEFEPPGDQENGYAFCWVASKLSPDEKILLVEGCVWACPYEFRFYDFSDPTKGWPELPIFHVEDNKETYMPNDKKAPVFNPDGTITCWETKEFYTPLQKYDNDITAAELKTIDPKEYDNPANYKQVERVKWTLRRDGQKLVLIDEWTSQDEKISRQKAKESRERYEAWEKEFKSADPLYLKYRELLKNSGWKAADYESRGTTYSGWAPDFDVEETRWCRRIIKESTSSYTVDLEWGVKTGPIKLQIFKNGNSDHNKFFEHSAEGMIQAFDYVKKLLGA